jgi:hypothetical protein
MPPSHVSLTDPVVDLHIRLVDFEPMPGVKPACVGHFVAPVSKVDQMLGKYLPTSPHQMRLLLCEKLGIGPARLFHLNTVTEMAIILAEIDDRSPLDLPDKFMAPFGPQES